MKYDKLLKNNWNFLEKKVSIDTINKLGDTLTDIGFKVLNIESLGDKDLWPRAAYTLVK